MCAQRVRGRDECRSHMEQESCMGKDEERYRTDIG